MADNNLFPVFDVPEVDVATQADTRSYKSSVYFDYNIGDFRRDGAHRMTSSTGKEAYIQWCIKVVQTERDALLAYSTDIGTEIETEIAQIDRESVESAIEKTITEALMVNVHTEYVRGFEFSWTADSIDVSFIIKGREWEEETVNVSYLM